MPVYKYSELPGKIKVGDKVRATKEGLNACGNLADGEIGIITLVEETYFKINRCTHLFDETTDWGESYELEVLSNNYKELNKMCYEKSNC